MQPATERLVSNILLLLLLPCLVHAQQKDRAPVILITIDTLRSDRVSCYGYAKAKTPNVATLAQDGVQFDNAYVQTPITLPSHASILTGTYPMFHKLQDVVGRLRDGVPTLATILKQSGYSTGAFVGSTVLSSRWMLNRGFDVYDDYFNIQEGLGQVDFDRIERKADEVLEPALAWLSANARGPYFLWVHLYDPHDPYTPPPPFDAEFRERPYDGEIAYVDSVLGRLLGSLRNQGLYEKSLIVLTSDHGESLGEHQEVHHGYFIYEPSLRVPLIFKFPGERFRGTRLPNIVRSVDIAPTILQYLGLALPATNQGESLLAMMSGKRSGVDLPVYAETYYPKIHFNWSPLFGYFASGHKYIDVPEAELYVLEKDPKEASNMLSSNQALAGRLKTELLALQKRYSFAQIQSDSPSSQVDPETLARLKALGYVAFATSTASRPADVRLPDPKSKIQIYNQLNRGIALSRRGMRDRAIEVFSQVAKSEPDMPIARFLLGLEYFEKQWYLKAIEEFQETLKRNPDSNVAMFNLARAYLESGQTEKAEAGFQYLLQREPANFGARHYLSLAYARRARFQEAAEEEVKALRVRPDFVEGYNNLGSFYLNLDKIDMAVEAYRKALSLKPDLLVVHINLALAYIRKGAYEEAIQHAQEVVNRDPRRPLAHLYLGQAYLARGMKDKAQEAFRKAKELNPKLNVPSVTP
jgi:arylsulfatase A-like enzyme/tetratricopeptide (TPR) repeat protein